MFMRGAGVRSIRSFLYDTQGNFAIMTAITLPLLLGAAGAGIEMNRVMQIKVDLQNVADNATLAVATDARLGEGKKTNAEYAQMVKEYLKHINTGGIEDEQKQSLDSVTDPVASRSETSKGTIFNISATMNYPVTLNPMLGFIGLEKITLTITSTAQSSFNKGAAMSLYLVLDRSGSMSFKTDTVDKSKSSCTNYTESSWPNATVSKPCYINKSTSLKTAVSYLVDTLDKSDTSYKAGGSPESTFVRTGAIAYNDASFSAQALSWGTSKSNTYVQAIPQYPTGGTNAYDALNTAYAALKSTNTVETSAHKEKGNASFQRFIVLMTDGEMTGYSASWNATIDAQVRSTCAAAKTDGIKIFTVAFMAPDKGKSLLQACASSADNYYAPENMEQIVAAFGDIARKAASITSRLTN